VKNSLRKEFRYNFIVNVVDGGFFGFALGFASFTTIIPLFVSQITNSAVLIGLIPAIHSMGWQLPQLFTAKKVASLARQKPFVMAMTVNERIPFFGLAIVAIFLNRLDPNIALLIIFMLLIWQGLGAGMTANAWMILVGKVIPSENRATFFGTQSAAANLLASIGAIIAGIILEKYLPNVGFMICFLIASIFMFISWFALSLTRESASSINNSSQDEPSVTKNVIMILKSDRPFLGFLISRVFTQFALMASSFYIVYGSLYLKMSEGYAGIMTSILLITQVVSNPIFGWLADRWGHRQILILGAIFALFAASIAWLAPSLAWFPLIMIFAGIGSSIFWTIGLAYTLEFGNDQNRPTYVGILNTLGAPSAILAPLIGGLIADSSGYPSTFLASAIFSMVTIIILISINRLQSANARETFTYNKDS
jgi:MFS family permease